MITADPTAARETSGRRLVIIAVIGCVVLSIVASLTSRSLWLRLGGAQPVSTRLYGAAVWPDHTRRAPALGLADTNGRVFTMPAQAGKVVLVAFWPSTCTGPCLREANALAAIRPRLAATARVELVVMSAGPAAGSPATARAFAARAGWDVWVWHWLFASPGRLAQLRQAFGLAPSAAAAHAPALFLVGRDGYERAALHVPVSSQQLLTDLRRLQH